MLLPEGGEPLVKRPRARPLLPAQPLPLRALVDPASPGRSLGVLPVTLQEPFEFQVHSLDRVVNNFKQTPPRLPLVIHVEHVRPP